MHRRSWPVVIGACCMAAMLAAAPPFPGAAEVAGDSTLKGPGMDQVLRMADFLAQLKQFSVTLDSG